MDQGETLDTLRAGPWTLLDATQHQVMTFDDRLRLLGRVELLVPILKAHCTDLAVEMASTAVQVLGVLVLSGAVLALALVARS